MKIESVELTKLVLDPVNARKHPDKNLEAIKGSLLKFGQQKPIVVDGKGVVIAGNGTLMAAKALGWDKIDVVKSKLDGLDKTAFALADNRTTDLSEWDDEVLGKLLQSLNEEDYAIADIGFEAKDIEELGLSQSKEGHTEDDAVPEVAENIHGVKRGDIWLLGKHRLMCGDSTSKDDVEKLMAGAKADMVFTDPPYGMGAVENSGVLSERYKPIVGDENADLAKKTFGKFCLTPGIWWGANYYSSAVGDASKWLVWNKNNGQSDQADCELAWTNLKGVVRMFTQASEKVNRVHPTQKPVSLVEWGLSFSDESQLIFDPFLGSGSTLIACEKTNRLCYGMEIDPHYCSVIIERWQQFTNQKAVKSGA